MGWSGSHHWEDKDGGATVVKFLLYSNPPKLGGRVHFPAVMLFFKPPNWNVRVRQLLFCIVLKLIR